MGGAQTTAQELHGRVRGTYQSVDGEDEEFESLLQDYRVNFRNSVTRNLFWQIRLRALVSDFNVEGEPGLDTKLLEPFLQLVYRGNGWNVSGGGRLTDASPRGRSEGLDEERQDLFARIGWTKPRKPVFNWSLNRVDIEEEGIDQSIDYRSLLSLSYGRRKGGTSLDIENRRFEDRVTGLERDRFRGTWNGNYRDAFADRRVILSGQALLETGTTEEEIPGTVDVDEQKRAARGLFAVDDTPAMGFLTNTPALIDGNLTASAADLSGDFRNIGVDFGFNETVDTVFIVVERRLLPGSENDYAWDVYTSGDGEFWNLFASSVRFTFEDLQNRFKIELPAPTTSQFLKVVNTRFSSNEPPLAVTEIQVFAVESRTGRQERDESRRSVNATATWRAHPRVDLNLNAFTSRFALEQVSGKDVREDWGTTLITTLRPGAGWASTLRLQTVSRSSTFGRSEDDNTVSLGFAKSPLPTLDFSIGGTHRRNTSRGNVLLESNALDMRVAARFVHDIQAAFDFSLIRQEDGILDRVTDRRQGNLTLNTTLRPGLILSANWRAERINFNDSGTADDRTDVDLRTRLSYRPTPVFGAVYEYLYQDISGESGTSYLFDVDWLPFPGGALQIQFTVTQDRRSIFGDVRDESRATLRWTMNPKTIIDFAYASIRVGDPSSPRNKLGTVFLEYRF